MIDSWIALIEEWVLIRGLTLLPFHGRSTFLKFGCLNVMGPISSDDFHHISYVMKNSFCRNSLLVIRTNFVHALTG